jgi:U6 snRNA-associated Sm-like protein LSm7
LFFNSCCFRFNINKEKKKTVTVHTINQEIVMSTTNNNTPGANSGGANKKGPPKKESILELAKLMDAMVRVKCLGGRELQGTLRGYDELVNVVLDDCEEFLRDPDDPEKVTDNTRRLGLVVVRGTQVSLVSPQEGVEEIANPFMVGDDDDEEE